MTTIIHLEVQRTSGIDRRHVKSLGHVGEATGACPGCGSAPFYVVGGGRIRISDDTYRANGRCQKCGDAVGYIFADMSGSTLFGLEEDEAVLSLDKRRARVY